MANGESMNQEHAVNTTMAEHANLHGLKWEPRRTKNKGSIIGGKKVQGKGNLGPKRGTPLKLVSAKQAHRTYELKKKFKRMLQEQDLHGEAHHCQKCGKVTNDYNKLKLVVDHVCTRNQTDADRYENLGILCWKCNSEKGSVREEYRPEWFIERMKELDKQN